MKNEAYYGCLSLEGTHYDVYVIKIFGYAIVLFQVNKNSLLLIVDCNFDFKLRQSTKSLASYMRK